LTVQSFGSIKLDLHNHTHFSSDGVQSPAELLAAAKAQGIDCLAITDHNTVRGALEGCALAAADATLPRVIPGVELMTAQGEVVGLYVEDEIPQGLPVEDAVLRIRLQGGLIYLPHPFDRVRRGAISARERSRVVGLADIVEVVNGRALCSRAGLRSGYLASRSGRLAGAGSDAHRVSEVGTACVLVEELPTRETLLDLLATGRIEHRLQARRYARNWFFMGMAPVTRWRRRLTALRV
jgi:predicted metal-dependent phosphoesterase TrpH